MLIVAPTEEGYEDGRLANRIDHPVKKQDLYICTYMWRAYMYRNIDEIG
jgi:hypothetical protein